MQMRKIIKSVLAYTLTLAILLSTLVFGAASTVSAESVVADFTAWDGSTDSNLEGSGTEADPYLIKTAAQLAAVVSSNNDGAWKGKYFKLANDIKINDTSKANWMDSVTKNWVWKDFRFTGTFDGDGHTIDGLYSAYGSKRVGLFAYTGYKDGYKCVIKNFKMTNAYITNTASVDGAGFVAGQASDVTYFHNIYIDDTCEIVTSTVNGVGGIVGRTDYILYMSNIAMNGKLSGKSNVGSFVGSQDKNALNITSSYSTADCYVTGNTNKTSGDICYLADASKNVYVAKKEGTIDAVASVITAEAIKGEGAKTAMPTLNFKTLFKTVEGGYPVPTTSQVWDGNNKLTDFSTFAGAGTEESPYLIENGNQLAFAVTKAGTDLHYKLVKDIVLNDTATAGWEAAAKTWYQNTNYRFSGEMDGDGHTIEGLYWNKTSGGRLGLFAYCGKASGGTHVAVFKDINFTGASISNSAAQSDGTQGAAIVAGQASGETIFENIYIDETCVINAPNIRGVAGLVGRGYNENTYAHITINNCAVLANMTGGSHVGAFLGTFWDDALKVTVNNSFAVTDKGLIGSNDGTATLTRVYTTTVSAEDTGAVQVDAENMKGENAKTYMPGLSFKYIWEITDSYPVLNVRGEIWNGSVASSYDDFEGNGTAADPYIIKNGAQLAFAVSENPNLADGSYFKLANDIILNDASYEGWEAGATPWLWNNHARFNGTLDGDGHTIEGLYINTSSTNGRLGLFAYIGKTTAMDKVAEVKNLTFTGASVTSTATSKVEGISIIAGQTSGLTHFENVYIDETCELTASDKAIGVGSFVGRGYEGDGGIASAVITNCATLATLSASTNTTNYVGAFVGTYWTDNSSVTINNSFTNINRPLSGRKSLSNSANNIGLVSYDSSTRVVEVENMKGLDANIHMAGLNFNQVWKTVENGYPVLTDLAYRADFWDGTSADGFAGGEGTEANPFIIKTANELYYLATLGTEDTAGKFFKLANNIVISNVRTDWEKESPYAWAVKDIDLEAEEYSNTFAGTLDGAGYTVSGIYFADFSYAHNNDAFGLLPSVSANAVIKNLTVSDAASSVTNSEYVGVVAGSVYLTPAEATNKLNKVHFVGVNLENSNLAVIGRGVAASKFDLCNAEVFSAVNGANAVTRNCNAGIAYTDDVIICNANTVNDSIKTIIRNIILGLDDSYVADVNGDGDFDICDLVAADTRYLA